MLFSLLFRDPKKGVSRPVLTAAPSSLPVPLSSSLLCPRSVHSTAAQRTPVDKADHLLNSDRNHLPPPDTVYNRATVGNFSRSC